MIEVWHSGPPQLCFFPSTPAHFSLLLPPVALQITMAEFVAATLGNSLQQREDFLRGLFQRFDSDGDQQITPGAGRGGRLAGGAAMHGHKCA